MLLPHSPSCDAAYWPTNAPRPSLRSIRRSYDVISLELSWPASTSYDTAQANWTLTLFFTGGTKHPRRFARPLELNQQFVNITMRYLSRPSKALDSTCVIIARDDYQKLKVEIIYTLSSEVEPRSVEPRSVVVFSSEYHIDMLTYVVPIICYEKVLSCYGEPYLHAFLFPDAPINNWISRIPFTNFFVAPRFFTRPTRCFAKTSPLLSKTHTKSKAEQLISCAHSAVEKLQKDVLIFRSHVQFIRRLLLLATFFLPNDHFYICPAPFERFLFRLNNRPPGVFLASKKVEKSLKTFRLSVNRVFPQSLGLAARVHSARKGSTWIADEVIDTLSWLHRSQQAKDKINQSCIFSGNLKSECFIADQKNGKTWFSELLDVKTLASFSWLLSQDEIPKWASRYIVKANPNSFFEWPWHFFLPEKALRDSCLEDTESDWFPPIRFYSFELWDVRTNSLAAATFCYVIGSVAVDYTHLTVIQDYRSCGKIVTLVAAELLKASGITLWYWGSKLPYMEAIYANPPYHGETIPSDCFYEHWLKEALGCELCKAPFKQGSHRRVKLNTFISLHQVRNDGYDIFICVSCLETHQKNNTSASLSYSRILDLEGYIAKGFAPVPPLDFDPLMSETVAE